MARRSLAADCQVKQDLIKASLNSDGLTGSGVPFTGWEKALVVVSTNTPSTSVAVLTIQFQKATAFDVATDCAASDWAAIDTDCSIVAATYSASTVGYLGAIEITIPSSDTSGLLRTSVLTPGEGLTVDGISVIYIFFNGSDQRPCTDWTPTYWPSS